MYTVQYFFACCLAIVYGTSQAPGAPRGATPGVGGLLFSWVASERDELKIEEEVRNLGVVQYKYTFVDC